MTVVTSHFITAVIFVLIGIWVGRNTNLLTFIGRKSG